MTIKIPQVSPWLEDGEAAAVQHVMRSGWLTEGPQSERFVAALNELVGAPFGVLAPNGTLALVLGLMAIGIGPGDEILIPDITFIGSATAAIMVGAIPVLVEVDAQTFQIDLAHAETRIGPRTRAIMPVHLFGTARDMPAVCRFADRHGLQVIEDAAQGIGVTVAGKPVGSFGDVGCFSFFADKTITTGEGGYVACRDPGVFDRLRLLRNQGRLDRGSFIHPAVGYNFRMTDLQSAIGLVQLDRLPRIVQRKQELLALYREGLSHLPGVRVLGAAEGANHVPFRCVLMTDRVRELMDHLERHGIQPRSFFNPLHRQPGLREWGAGRLPVEHFDDAAYPNAVFGWDHGVCLPVHATLTDLEIQFVCETIVSFYSQRGVRLAPPRLPAGPRDPDRSTRRSPRSVSNCDPAYAGIYDQLYAEKQYATEVGTVLELLGKGVSSVLDVGCGTGRHAREFAARGIFVTGIDLDAEMIAVAVAAVPDSGPMPSFYVGGPAAAPAGPFDAATALFNVINYLSDARALLEFFGEIGRRLRPGAPFLFDAWNGLAAIAHPPRIKRVEFEQDGRRVVSVATPETDLWAQRTTMHCDILVAEAGRPEERIRHSFDHRLWTPRELRDLLDLAGFASPLAGTWTAPNRPALPDDWKLLFRTERLP